MKAGEEKDIDITFPENYHEDLAGKAVVFHVKVHEVKAKEVPALDDEFAKDVSEFDTLKELKSDLKKKITEERESAANREFEDTLMKQVAENITCDVPESMVNAQAARFVENFKTQIQSSGISYDQYLKMAQSDEAQLLEDAKKPALQQVRIDLAVGAIIQEEKIEVSDEEIEAEYKRMSETYNMDVETVKKYLQKEAVEDQVKTQKALNIVTESAIATKPEEKPEEKPDAQEEAPAEEKKPAAKKAASKKTEGEEKKPAQKKSEAGEKKPRKTTKKTAETK